MPIIVLVISNTALVFIVRKSRNKMRKSVNIPPKVIESKKDSNAKQKLASLNCFVTNSSSNNANKPKNSKNSCADIKKAESNLPLLKAQKSNRNRQENQLTWMTIAVAILYLVTSIPMVFAYPGLIFRCVSNSIQN